MSNEKKIVLLLAVHTVGLVVALLFCSLLLGGYSVEIETGKSLKPLLGRYSILIVSYQPQEINVGDIVTVYTADGSIVLARKRIAEVDIFVSEDGNIECWIRLEDGVGKDWGWYPVHAVRSKVELVLFGGI